MLATAVQYPRGSDQPLAAIWQGTAGLCTIGPPPTRPTLVHPEQRRALHPFFTVRFTGFTSTVIPNIVSAACEWCVRGLGKEPSIVHR